MGLSYHPPPPTLLLLGLVLLENLGQNVFFFKADKPLQLGPRLNSALKKKRSRLFLIHYYCHFVSSLVINVMNLGPVLHTAKNDE